MIPSLRVRIHLLLVTLLSVGGLVNAAEPLQLGLAEVDITPPKGFPIAGYYHERLATGTLDPLKAKAIVFSGNGEQAALVVCDLTGIAADLSEEVRRHASQKTGIPAEHIVISGTHSHTAPDYSKDLYEHLAATRAGNDSPSTYSPKLITGIVAAVIQAQANVQPVTLDAGTCSQAEAVSFNRRFVMKDGSVRTWMRLDNPDVIGAAGPIDSEIGLLRIRAADGDRTLGVMSNFALHLDTVGGTQWSGDYPYYIEQVLRRSLGKELVSIFGTGCCGDINHVDPVKKERNKTDFIGQSLGTTIEAGLAKLVRIDSSRLHVGRAIVQVPLQSVSSEQVATAQPLVTEARSGKQVEFFALVTAYKSLILDQLTNKPALCKSDEFLSWGLTHRWAGVGKTLPVEVQVITIGKDVAIVCLPGEVFVDLGLAIKRASPFKTTLIVELCNCVETVYIPHRAAYAGGSYEVTNSTLQPGAGEMLVEAAVRLLRESASQTLSMP